MQGTGIESTALLPEHLAFIRYHDESIICFLRKFSLFALCDDGSATIEVHKHYNFSFQLHRQPQDSLDVPTFYLTMFDNAIFEGYKLGIGIDIDIDSAIQWTSAPAWLVNISFLNIDHNTTLPSTMIRMALRMPAWTTTDATVDVRIGGASGPTCDSNQPGNFCIILNNFSAGTVWSPKLKLPPLQLILPTVHVHMGLLCGLS